MIGLDENSSHLLDKGGRGDGATCTLGRQPGGCEYARSLIEASLDPLVTISPEGKITYANEAAVNVTGVPRESLIGTDFFDYFIEPERARVGYQRVVSQGFVTDYPLTIRHRDGRLTDVLYNASVYKDTRGKVLGVFAAARDVTAQKQASIALEIERKQMEEQARQTQKMEAVGQLAGGIAHDFNNLMTIVTSYCEVLLTSPEVNDASKALLQEIATAGERAAALTRQLLVFSHKQVSAPKVLDLNAVVAETEKMLRRLIGEDVVLTTSLEAGLGRVKADIGQLEQVIINLAVNSRDAMPTGGKLTVATQNVELDAAAALQFELRPGSYVLLAVSDTGCGMSEDLKTHIFEPFFTTKGLGKGTGLGLATVYAIVRQCGGHVSVSSEPGMGATFSIHLPMVEAAAPCASIRTGQPSMPRGHETILLVEDEAAVRSIARFALQVCGYTVLEAANGEQALQIDQDHDGPLDLIVTDVVMPHFGGSHLVQQILSRRAQIKILYMSGYTDDQVISHGVFQEKVAFLQKPFTPRVLASKVREVLDSDPVHLA